MNKVKGFFLRIKLWYVNLHPRLKNSKNACFTIYKIKMKLIFRDVYMPNKIFIQIFCRKIMF